jgi:hypothetical protein
MDSNIFIHSFGTKIDITLKIVFHVWNVFTGKCFNLILCVCVQKTISRTKTTKRPSPVQDKAVNTLHPPYALWCLLINTVIYFIFIHVNIIHIINQDSKHNKVISQLLFRFSFYFVHPLHCNITNILDDIKIAWESCLPCYQVRLLMKGFIPHLICFMISSADAK